MALVFKLGSLIVKTAAKPLATRVKDYVINHPVLRKRVIRMGQYLHRTRIAIERSSEGKEGRVFVGDINEDLALENASRLISEGFLFAVGAGLIVIEMRRSENKDRDKRAKEASYRQQVDRELQEERKALSVETNQIRSVMAAVQQRQDQLQQQLDALEKRLEASSAPKKWKLL